MSHKAYALRYESFQAELAPVLLAALATREATGLEAFVVRNRAQLSVPWDAAPLPAAWAPATPGSVQELADVALTLFYDPGRDFGLAEAWRHEDEQLPEAARACLLGETFGPPGAVFDPGLQGSYFQSPDAVIASERTLQVLRRSSLQQFLSGLAVVRQAGAGLYVTF
jgi:hypothetical protein